jgi:uncharacterized protein
MTKRVYLDTSALVSLYAREPGSAQVESWLHRHRGPAAAPAPDKLVVSDWAIAEFASALGIKLRRGDFSSATASAVWTLFTEACDADFEVETMLAADLAQATHFCLQATGGLRASDALHLSAAQRLGCDTLLSLDAVLNRNASAQGLAVLSA